MDIEGSDVFELSEGMIPLVVQNVIALELMRNIMLSVCAIFLCIFCFLGDCLATIMVTSMVVITLANVAGNISIVW